MTQNFYTKICIAILTGYITILNTSCNWHIFKKSTYITTPHPEICDEFDKNYNYKANRLKSYSVEESLTIQKCGLDYRPQHQLQNDIANLDEYPVPAIIHRLRTDNNEEFQYYLILDLIALAESIKHRKQIWFDKNLVIKETQKAISKMQDEVIKKYAEEKFILLKKIL